jgi:hypothetical protein
MALVLKTKYFCGDPLPPTFMPRIGFCRTCTQPSGTQSAAADGTRTRWLFELRRFRSLIEVVRGNLRTNGPDSDTRSLRVGVRVGVRTMWCTVVVRRLIKNPLECTDKHRCLAGVGK